MIAAFLAPAISTPQVDAKSCLDCGGTGYWYPEGAGKGIAKCNHPKLSDAANFLTSEHEG
ncbi:MAG: hypothetical protein MSG64_17945 [Pyrinomonadaceae bacterium MAG19_C2-C3]|nr:hypothetical protein [Pyrinomonadaceae bacterium MAG19_C2-C3]